MKRFPSLLWLLLFLCNKSFGNDSDLVLHPVPQEFGSDLFKVTVNGKEAQVFHAGLNVYFVSFDFNGAVDVTVQPKFDDEKHAGQTSNKEATAVDEKGYWRGSVTVRPLSRNVQPQLTGATVRFSLTQAGQYSIERQGTSNFKDEVLFIFANKKEPPLPSSADANIIHLKAGIHQGNIELKSGQTLYLDAGAVLFGGISVWDAKNVTIAGRGVVVYYGPQSETHDDGWMNKKAWHPLTTHNVQGLTVSGVTFVGRSRTWSLQTHTTFDAVFDNIKIIAVNPQNINGDGIDWYGGGRAVVRNSFVRSMDDCFAFFTPGSSADMWANTKNTAGEVADIAIENCVFWPTLANVFRIGFNGQALTTRNISMKNTDVIHIGKGEWYAPWALFCAVSPNSKGKAVHSDYLMEGIRFEEPAALFGLQNPEAVFKNIVLKNITVTGAPASSLVKSEARDIEFINVVVNGKTVKSENDLPLREGSRLNNVKYR